MSTLPSQIFPAGRAATSIFFGIAHFLQQLLPLPPPLAAFSGCGSDSLIPFLMGYFAAG
jgi:hypothetical protein